MKIRASILLLSLLPNLTEGFVAPGNQAQNRFAVTSLSASSSSQLVEGDAVLLIGPGFLQLNVAKAAKAAGLKPIIVAPQKNIEKFVQYVNDADLIRDATIGIPDPGEPYYGKIGGVVYCAEDAIVPDSFIGTVLDWKDRDVFCPDGIKRAIGCVPISGKINKEKSMGWMPIFNNDKNEKEVWTKFTQIFKSHPVMKEE